MYDLKLGGGGGGGGGGRELTNLTTSNNTVLYVTVEGRNQTLFTLSTFEKKSSKSRNFYCRASVMTKVNFD